MPKTNLNLYITRTITDTKTGKIIKKSRRKQSKSFVKAFLQFIELFLAHSAGSASTNVTVKDTSNTDRSLDWGAAAMSTVGAIEAPVGTITYGILIGTGITPPATADYTIETQIAHGVGAGQMQHQVCSVAAAGIVGASMEVDITRAFINGSGGTIVVKEVGIVCVHTTAWYFLIIHDAVDDSVANGQTYTVTYTLQTTV